MTAEQIAPVVHEALRAYQRAVGQQVGLEWEEATWEKRSTIEAVAHALGGGSPREQHERWQNERIASGCKLTLVAFDDLPEVEKAKDELIVAISRALMHVGIDTPAAGS